MLVDQFLSGRRLAGCKRSTLKTYRKHLAALRLFARDRAKPLPELTPDELLDFLGARTCADVTRRGYWTSVRALFRWANLTLNLPNPTVGLRPRFAAAPPRRPPSYQVIETILEAIAAADTSNPVRCRDRMLYMTQAYTGARLGEILALTVNAIELENKLIWFYGAKTNRHRAVPIPVRLQEALLVYLPSVSGRLLFSRLDSAGIGRDLPLGRDTMSHRWRAYATAAGYPHIRDHDLRHAYVTQLHASGADLHTAGKLVGHASITVTSTVYAHLLPATAARAVAAAFE